MAKYEDYFCLENPIYFLFLPSILFVFGVYLKPKNKNTFQSIFKKHFRQVKNRLPAA